MRANRLPARRGLTWVGAGFALFRVAPLRLLLLNLLFLLLLLFSLAIPLAGFAVAWLLFPALMLGPHALARAAEAGTPPTLQLFWSGFRERLPTLLMLGGVFLGGMLLVVLASSLADGGGFAKAIVGFERLRLIDLKEPALQNAFLTYALLQAGLLSVLWYAPLLGAWRDVPPVKAVFFSVAATLMNWRALLVFGLALSLLFTLVLMLALGTTLALGGPAALERSPAPFAVVWTLLPIWFAGSYASYREIFAEPAPQAQDGTGPAPGGAP
jgi:hypothetical protein